MKHFDQYQVYAHSTNISMEDFDRRFPECPKEVRDLMALSYLSNGLGEVQGKVKKLIRGDKSVNQQDIIKELGDVLWYVSEIATHYGIKLSDVAQQNIQKIQSRMERGVLRGSGDDR